MREIATSLDPKTILETFEDIREELLKLNVSVPEYTSKRPETGTDPKNMTQFWFHSYHSACLEFENQAIVLNSVSPQWKTSCQVGSDID